MPNYISKIRQRFNHREPSKPEHSPYKAPPRKYGLGAQDPIPPDDTAEIDEKRVRVVQQVIGGCLYYARAVDDTILMALSAIASEQAAATENIERKVLKLFFLYFLLLPLARLQWHSGP